MFEQRHSAPSFTRALGVLVLVSGCMHAASPAEEARSIAEQDLAVDAKEHGRLREALAHCQQSMKLNPDNAEATHVCAVVLIGFCALDATSGDCRLKEAEGLARRTLEIQPDHREAKNTLGVILLNEHRIDEAIAVLKPLTEDLIYAHPESAWGNLGLAYLDRGSPDEAIDALHRAVAVQPLFCVGNYRLGLAYEKKGDLPSAQEAFTRAVDTDHPACKRLQDAYGARARVLARQGLKEQARADLTRCRDMASQTPTGQKCAAELQTYQ